MDKMLKNKDSKRIVNLLSGSSILFKTEDEQKFLKGLVSSFEKVQYNTKIDYSLSPEIAQFIPFEEPDLIIYCNNKLYALEHFVIDASVTTKKGSSFKRKYNDKNSELIKPKDDGLKTTKIETSLNYYNLSLNFKKNFESHYNKINKYKSNVSTYMNDIDCNVNYIFIIEYDLIFPSFFINNNQMNFIFPDNDINIIHFLEKMNKLTGLICIFKGDSNRLSDYCRFIGLSNENIRKYSIDDVNIFNIEGMQIHDFENPVYSSCKITIPIDS